MKQEDYNDVMRDLNYINKINDIRGNKKCPKCGFYYLGDGIKPCIECELLLKYRKSDKF
jgi:predicted Zn-ribbon and HTH transcriptional regulator